MPSPRTSSRGSRSTPYYPHHRGVPASLPKPSPPPQAETAIRTYTKNAQLQRLVQDHISELASLPTDVLAFRARAVAALANATFARLEAKDPAMEHPENWRRVLTMSIDALAGLMTAPDTSGDKKRRLNASLQALKPIRALAR